MVAYTRSFYIPIEFTEILIDDIEQTVSIKRERKGIFYTDTFSFDEIDELRRRAVLASARGRQLNKIFTSRKNL